MPVDEQAIRELIAEWMRATAAGDVNRLLPLMADDVVFLTPGQPSRRGREAFAAAFRQALQHVRIEPTSEIQEIRVAGDLSYCWSRLSVTVTPRQGGAATRRQGYSLTILSKKPDGRWVLTRDANLLTVES